MADENKKSRADDMFDMLKDFEGESKQAPVEKVDVGGTTAPKNENASEKDAYFNELLDILAKPIADEPEEEEQDFGINCEDELPSSIFAHLSDEASNRVMPTDDMHFVEEIKEEEPVVEEEVVEQIVRKRKKKDEEPSKGKRILQSVLMVPKAVIYVVIVLLVSAYLSYFIITVGNDVFALVTDEGEVEIKIEEGMTDKDVAKLLKDNDIIQYDWVYELYMKYRGDGDSANEYIVGIHTLNLNDNYSQIINKLTLNTKARDIVRVTIPEGFTVDEIINELVGKGVGTKEGYVDAINNYPYKWEFVQKLDEMGYSEDRIYRLEGYLYPDTYEFYTDTSEVYVINKMLAAFDNRFWSEFKRDNGNGTTYEDLMLKKYNMTFDDIITLASIVQAEGKKLEDFYAISDVFHNRLSHPNTYPKLESDATIQYVLPERETDSSQINLSFDSPYNTYMHNGLTPGAICNPGLDSLFAAMFPSKAKNNNGREITAYFFVSNDAGKTYYADGPGGHANNVAQAKKDNEAIKNGTYKG